MNITEIIIKSLGEAVKPRRFFPFFILYLLFFISALVFTNSILQVLPSIILLQFTEMEITVVMFNMIALLLIFLMLIGVDIWFTGALVYDLYKNKGFDAGLRYSKKFYLKIIFLSSIIFIFVILSGLFGGFGIIIRLLVDWAFMFSLAAIIIKGDDVQLALTRSYNIVRKNLVKTFGFLIFAYFIVFLILVLCMFLVTISLYPLFLNLTETLTTITDFQTISSQQLLEIIALIPRSYPSFIISSIIASLFLSFTTVFIHVSRTYFFLSFKKK